MKKTALPVTAGLMTLLLAGCAAPHGKPPAGDGKVTPQMRSGSGELRAWQLLDWVAPDDRTLIVNTADRSLLRASFRGRCTGLRLTDTVAFIVPSATPPIRYEGVVLPDGTRCVFSALTRLDSRPAAAAKPAQTESP